MKGILGIVLFFLLIQKSFALINGYSPRSNFPSIKLVFKNKSHICSGTFIDPYTILTAAHCIKEPQKKWDNFSLELESIYDAKSNKIKFKQIKNIPHPDFKYSQIKSKNDVGLIKVEKNRHFKSFPEIGNQSHGAAIFYGCGRINLENKERKCLEGKNNVFPFLGFLLAWGKSSNTENRESNVSVAPNDKLKKQRRLASFVRRYL